MIFLVSILASFVSVFFKGFQHKNVIGGHIKSVALTSYAMAATDVLTVTLIVKGGWWIALSSGTGAALGMVTSIWLHDRLYKKNDK